MRHFFFAAVAEENEENTNTHRHTYTHMEGEQNITKKQKLPRPQI